MEVKSGVVKPKTSLTNYTMPIIQIALSTYFLIIWLIQAYREGLWRRIRSLNNAIELTPHILIFWNILGIRLEFFSIEKDYKTYFEI